MKSMEIYFRDLNPDAQKRYLEMAGVKSSAEELSTDVSHLSLSCMIASLNPIAIVNFAEPEDQ